jgi:hypothetical protein
MGFFKSLEMQFQIQPTDRTAAIDL